MQISGRLSYSTAADASEVQSRHHRLRAVHLWRLDSSPRRSAKKGYEPTVAIRDKMRESVEPYLEPGEQIQAVWAGQSHSQWLMVATGFIPFLFFNRYMTVAATDRRILVGDSGRWSQTKFNEVVAEAPRQSQVGPASGLWHRTDSLGVTMRVHKRFFKDIEQADALAGFEASELP